MTIARMWAFALATILIATCAPALAATTPKPSTSPHAVTIPPPKLPNEKLHAEYVVEVNKKGQVVRIKSGRGTKYATFNAQTYGNALQMWIRKADGTAEVGLYKVTYDYDPKTHHVDRRIALVSKGGTWGDAEGAANVMLDTAKKEAAAAQKQQQQAEHAKLPSLNQITGKKTSSPSPAPVLSPRP
ncbi:MAG: hypothetical protein ABI231_00035 [Candidatus Tumulicola sp.]